LLQVHIVHIVEIGMLNNLDRQGSVKVETMLDRQWEGAQTIFHNFLFPSNPTQKLASQTSLGSISSLLFRLA